HAAAEFLVEPLNHVCGAERLPLRFGEAEEREEFVAAFPQARYDAGAALGPRALEGRVRAAGSIDAARTDDPMEVVADRHEGVLRGLAFEVAQLMHAAPLHRGLRPYQTDGTTETGIAVDDAEHGSAQPARGEIVKATLPRGERLAGAEVEGQELLAAVGEHTDHAQHRHARDRARAAHTEGEAVEVEIDCVDVGERAGSP